MIVSPLGRDVAKLKFNACLLRQDAKSRHRGFPNTLAGFAQLIEWLGGQCVTQSHACLEATGTYGDVLAT